MLSVGRFNGPHLLSVQDSTIIGSKLVVTDIHDRIRGEVEGLNEEFGAPAPATEFEVLASAAMMAFERLKMDSMVIEVGMSGRLDATDATKPLLCPLCQRRRRPPRVLRKRGGGDWERGGNLEEREAVRVEEVEVPRG